MKKLSTAYLLVLVLTTSGFAVVVSTTAGLNEAVSNNESLIELNAPEFLLDSGLIIDHNCVFRPHSGRSGQGGVTIDGNNLYKVSFLSAEFTVGQDDPCNVLTFTKGGMRCVWVSSADANTTAVFHYCRFINAFQGNGLDTRSGAYEVAVTCNYCEASYNYGDGFNMHNLYSDQAQHVLTLNNCSATGNDRESLGGSCGDGASAHSLNHTLYIHGGVYHNNGKTGVALDDGAKCYICGNTQFYNNGLVRHIGDVYAGENSALYIADTKFKNLNYPLTGYGNVTIEASTATFVRCLFENSVADSEKGAGIFLWRTGLGGKVNVQNCIFTGAGASQTAVYLDSGDEALVSNCTFYRNARHIGIQPSDPEVTSKATIVNCILKDASKYAVICADNRYSDDPNSGYNCFHGNNIDLHGDSGGLGASDIESDPLLVDANNGDFHVLSEAGRWDPNSQEWFQDAATSPCIDVGDPNFDWADELWPHGRRINIGAYGGTAEASMSISNAGNVCDLDNDGIVDGKDFSRLGAKWLVNEALLPEDYDRDSAVSSRDLAILGQNWLWSE